MPQADVGCDEHHLLDEQTESTRVGIGKKKMLFGICLSMAVVMIGLGAKMMTSSKLNDGKSADTSAVLMGTDFGLLCTTAPENWGRSQMVMQQEGPPSRMALQ